MRRRSSRARRSARSCRERRRRAAADPSRDVESRRSNRRRSAKRPSVVALSYRPVGAGRFATGLDPGAACVIAQARQRAAAEGGQEQVLGRPVLARRGATGSPPLSLAASQSSSSVDAVLERRGAHRTATVGSLSTRSPSGVRAYRSPPCSGCGPLDEEECYLALLRLGAAPRTRVRRRYTTSSADGGMRSDGRC